jgi:hypothetical protein
MELNISEGRRSDFHLGRSQNGVNCQRMTTYIIDSGKLRTSIITVRVEVLNKALDFIDFYAHML